MQNTMNIRLPDITSTLHRIVLLSACMFMPVIES